MNRCFRAATVAALLTGGLGSAGCASRTGMTLEDRYRNAIDESWPDRYNYAARQSALAPFAQQAANGHFINQTLWNWYFEPGTAKLTPGGMEKLDSLARVNPGPDTRLYLQTARDIRVTPDNEDKVLALRDELNGQRAASIKRYVATQPGPALDYEVYVHDAPVPGIYSIFSANSFRGQGRGYVGGINAGGGGGGGGLGGGGGGGLGGQGGAGTGAPGMGAPGTGPGGMTPGSVPGGSVPGPGTSGF